MGFLDSHVQSISLVALVIEALALAIIAGAFVSIAVSLKSKRKEK